MSVATEITKLQTNLSDAYDAVGEKGGTIPAKKVFDNLASAINSIVQKGSDVSLYTVTNGTITQPKINITNSFINITAIAEYGLALVFCKHSNVSGTLSFPKLKIIEAHGMFRAFSGCSLISGVVDLSALEMINESGLQEAFANTGLSGGVNFTKLTSISANGLASAFLNCNSMDGVINFPALYNVDSTAFGSSSADYAFAGTNITEIHFPAALEATIKAINGYGDKWGSSAIISFDL